MTKIRSKCKMESTEETGTNNSESNFSDGTMNPDNIKKRNLRQNSGIHYGVFDLSSDDDLDFTKPKKERSVKNPRSKKSKKESKKWKPEEGFKYRPQIEEAPIFYPNEEEFKDTLGYIAKIRPEAEKFGICKIIPPESWAPPCMLKKDEFYKRVKFTTRLQEVNKLQNREPVKKKKRKRKRKGVKFGMNKRRNNVNFNNNEEDSNSNINNNDCDESHNNNNDETECGSDSEEKFGFYTGSDFTLEGFEKFANKFKQKYFQISCENSNSNDENKDNTNVEKERSGPSVEEIEGEYWRIVEEANQEVEVHYGADLDTAKFGSGFPKAKDSNLNEINKYKLSGWNLNNSPRLPGSVLSFEKEEISGVLVPWLYVGMCFSSFCWHVEDHHLYSLNYMHFGEPKVWYGVSGTNTSKLENAMKTHLPNLFEQQPDLLHELVTQLSPTILTSSSVPVSRLTQSPHEFILTFPRAYHAGFNCGFNCAEAVNLAPAHWLPFGLDAVELYRQQRRRTSVSNDKLLLEVAKEAVGLREGKGKEGREWDGAKGKEGVLTKAVKVRLEMEKKARQTLNPNIKLQKLPKSSNSLTEKECFSCFFDLHLSGCFCSCNPTRYACLNHAQLLCSCEVSKKCVTFRYDLDELDVLVEALEGDLKAVERWVEIEKNDSDYDDGDKDKDNGSNNNNSINNNSLDMNVKSETDKDIKSNKQRDTKSNQGNTQLDIKSNNDNQGHNQSVNINIKSEIVDKDVESSSQGHFCKSSSRVFGVDFSQSQNSQSRNNQNSQSLGCLVELLEIGKVMRGNSWSCKDAIFTKGFKSRVEYFSVLEPTKKCNYISEVLDAGVLGPLFKVRMEERPDISFTEASPIQCWNLVKERLNEEMLKFNGGAGQTGQLVPSVEIHLEAVDGLEMFGFRSPHIIQAIEDLFANIHSKPSETRNISPSSNYPTEKTKSNKSRKEAPEKIFGVDLVKKEEGKVIINSDSSPEEIKMDKNKLKNLFEKANIEELKVMYKVFSSGSGSQNWRSAFEVLSETMCDQLTK